MTNAAAIAPDLQKLVQRYGGYLNIPPEEWHMYDLRLRACNDYLAKLHKVQKRKKSDLSADNSPDFFTPGS